MNARFNDVSDPQDLLSHAQVAIGQAVSGEEGDRHECFLYAVMKIRWDRSPGSKIILTPRIHQPRLTIVSWTMVSRSREGDTTRYRLWDVSLKD